MGRKGPHVGRRAVRPQGEAVCTQQSVNCQEDRHIAIDAGVIGAELMLVKPFNARGCKKAFPINIHGVL